MAGDCGSLWSSWLLLVSAYFFLDKIVPLGYMRDHDIVCVMISWEIYDINSHHDVEVSFLACESFLGVNYIKGLLHDDALLKNHTSQERYPLCGKRVGLVRKKNEKLHLGMLHVVAS